MSKGEPAVSRFVNAVMTQWRMCKQSSRMQACVRKALSELPDQACGLLLGELLQVKVLPDATPDIQAYFPMHHRHQARIRHIMHPRERTQVLLVLGASHFEETPAEPLEDQLRAQFERILPYLRDPKARSERVGVQQERRADNWDRSALDRRLKALMANGPQR